MPTSTSANRLLQWGSTVVASLTLVACASAPSPAPALAVGDASLEAARAANASELAAVDMHAARDKLQRARTLAQAGKPEEAIRLAEQADADAQLARARSGSQRARLALDEVDRGLRTLREELARNPGNSSASAPGIHPRGLTGQPAAPARTTP